MSGPCIEDYTIGWICALQEEYEAACRMLDDEFEGPETSDANDNNTYVFGRISEHKVVIGCLPDGRYGISSAAVVARDMVRSFPSLRFALMVGIGGGAPTPDRDIRLGDVVVSVPQGRLGGVIQYDFGKRLPDGRFLLTGQMNSPPEVLLGVIPEMRRRHNDPRKPDRILEHLRLIDDMPEYKRPAEDRLYRANYEHKGGITCASCATNGLEQRPLRETKQAVTVHYGIIASANSVMKNAEERDKYARDPELNILCFEMEAAGLMNNFPCLVIRGICDYSDSHKNDEWHKFAALVAAAYARELLHVLKPQKVTVLPSWVGNVERILADLQKEISATSGKTDTIIHHQRTQEARDILDWLTPVNYGSQQSDYFGRRQPGTGRWLLDTVEFRTWRDTCGQTLFCPGIPGAGKTILTSIVVDNLETLFGMHSDVGIAYIYYNFRRQDEQTAKEVLASLLKQLVQSLPTFPESVKSLYDKHMDKRSRPSLEEVSSTLHSTTSLYSRVFVLIDALDECRTYDDSRATFLAEIFKLPVNIFATSRLIPNIMESFKDSITLEIRARDEDVRTYVHNHISRLPASIRHSPELQEEVISGIIDSVGGVFLLAQLCLESLIGKTSVKAVRSALTKLPSGSNAYDHAYETAMERIERQVPDHRDLAKQVLSWITCAKRQLSTVELQHALAVEVGTTELDKDALPEIEEMVLVCVGLVTIDEQSKIIRLVHYTTQQYFDKNREKWFTNAEADITTTCVTYMSFDVFESGFCHEDKGLKERMRLNPFYHYSAHHWGDHARESPTLCQEVIDFLESDTKVESSFQALMAEKTWIPRKVTGLHLAAYFGIRDGIQILTRRNAMDRRDSHGRTPLSWAADLMAYIGIRDGIQILTRRNAMDRRDTDGRTPLSWAAERGHEDIVELLLGTGKVDVDAKDWHGRTPLSWAAGLGREDIVKLLLDTGKVDVDAKDQSGRTPLSWAAYAGSGAIVKLLLDTGKVDIDGQDKNGWTPLSWAAGQGREDIVKLLLDTGKVDVDAKDQSGQTPLSWAAQAGSTAIVKLLLDTGKVDINVRDTDYGPYGYEERLHEFHAQMFFNRGKIDMNARDTRYGQTPLFWAADRGHKAIVKLLLDTGKADVDAKDGCGRTPLLGAAGRGHEATVKLLLDTGKVNLNAEDVSGRTPLSWAAQERHSAIVKLLLDTGQVDVDAEDQSGRTPLSWAVQERHWFMCGILGGMLNKYIQDEDGAVVKLLLDTGKVDVDAKDQSGRTPLSWAAGRGRVDIVKLLLDTGQVNIDSQDKDGKTPLWWAAFEWRDDIAELLLDTGNIDVDAKDGCGQTPLLGAAGRGHEATVKLLLDTGKANVNARDTKDGWTPLLWAAKQGHKAIVKLLLD
ncbi:nucleoside phosphorylase domain protein, partial [Fusarium beomiforme]